MSKSLLRRDGKAFAAWRATGAGCRRFAISVLAVIVAFGCALPSWAAGERYALISHASDADTWWRTVELALKQAAADFGVTVDYLHPPDGSMAGMARLIDRAAANRYDGIVSTIGSEEVQQALRRVVAKNIPLITINSGTRSQSERLGAIMHVGQPEYEAGRGAGVRARAAGVKSFVCVNTFSQSPISHERCRGFAEAIGLADYRSSMLDAGVDASAVGKLLATWLHDHPDPQAVLTLGPDGAAAALSALDKMGLKGKLWFATFDLSDIVARAIRTGDIQFAIDQQPYLQAYIPIAVLTLMRRERLADAAAAIKRLSSHDRFKKRLDDYALTPHYGERHIDSGPGFVTKRNIDAVERHAGTYR